MATQPQTCAIGILPNRRNTPKSTAPRHKSPILPILPQIHGSIMQNKPNSRNAKTNATAYATKSYTNIPLHPTRKNKPNSNPNQTQNKLVDAPVLQVRRGGAGQFPRPSADLQIPQNPIFPGLFRPALLSAKVGCALHTEAHDARSLISGGKKDATKKIIILLYILPALFSPRRPSQIPNSLAKPIQNQARRESTPHPRRRRRPGWNRLPQLDQMRSTGRNTKRANRCANRGLRRKGK